MMRFTLGREEPDPKCTLMSALTIGFSSIALQTALIGGLAAGAAFGIARLLS